MDNSCTTLIENILTNKVDANITSGNIVSDISDHFSQFCVSHTFFKKPKSRKEKRRDFSGFLGNRFNSDLLGALLNQTNFDDRFDVDNAFSHFYNLTLSRLAEKHAPLKTLSKRKLKQFSEPWITSGLKKSTNWKWKIPFFNQAITYNTNPIEIRFLLLLGWVKRIIITHSLLASQFEKLA